MIGGCLLTIGLLKSCSDGLGRNKEWDYDIEHDKENFHDTVVAIKIRKHLLISRFIKIVVLVMPRHEASQRSRMKEKLIFRVNIK